MVNHTLLRPMLCYDRARETVDESTVGVIPLWIKKKNCATYLANSAAGASRTLLINSWLFFMHRNGGKEHRSISRGL
jgi:hypothetical protein